MVPTTCNDFDNKTITIEFPGIFAVVPTASSNSSTNPINSIWTLWHEISALPEGQALLDNYEILTSNNAVGEGGKEMKWEESSVQ